MSFEKIEKDLPGYDPQWTVHKGAEELYEAYRALDLSEEQFLSEPYYRIATIAARQEANTLDKDLRPIDVTRS